MKETQAWKSHINLKPCYAFSHQTVGKSCNLFESIVLTTDKNDNKA